MMKTTRYNLFRNQPGRKPVLISHMLTQAQCRRAVEADAEWLSKAMRLSDFEIRQVEWTAEYA